MMWGREHEEVAIRSFENVFGKVRKCGVILHHSGRFGGSPDGYLEKEPALLEVKCPYSAKDGGITKEWLWKKACFLACDSGAIEADMFELGSHRFYVVKNSSVQLKTIGQGKKYFHQVQGCMALAGVAKCYFYVWTPQESLVFVVNRVVDWESNWSVLRTVHQQLLSELEHGPGAA